MKPTEAAPSPTPSVPAAKAALRAELRRRLAGLSADRRATASAQACERLRAQGVWRQAGVVLAFMPLADELDIAPLLAAALSEGKRLCLPRFNAATGAYEAAEVGDLTADLRPGRFGVLEPDVARPGRALKGLDLTLAPGVGFDHAGHRLGRGKGFYDRLLAQATGVKCGIGFDEQLIAALPVEPHDVKLDCIVTPTRWLTFGPLRL